MADTPLLKNLSSLQYSDMYDYHKEILREIKIEILERRMQKLNGKKSNSKRYIK